MLFGVRFVAFIDRTHHTLVLEQIVGLFEPN